MLVADGERVLRTSDWIAEAVGLARRRRLYKAKCRVAGEYG